MHSFVVNVTLQVGCHYVSSDCGHGEELNSDCNGCILTNICLRDHPCRNGGRCIIGSVPNKYTCDCSNTGYTGKICDFLSHGVFPTMTNYSTILKQRQPSLYQQYCCNV